MPGASPRTRAARKIQAIFRKKRIFTENTGIKFLNRSAIPPGVVPGTFEHMLAVEAAEKNADIKFSKSTIMSFVASIKASVKMGEVLAASPKGFREVAGYSALAYKPKVRYVGGEWIGDATGINYVTAKRGKMTVLLAKDEVRVSGPGNLEEMQLALQWCHKNGWITAAERDSKVTFKTINGKFTANRKIRLETLAFDAGFAIPRSLLVEAPKFQYEKGIAATGLKSVVIKFAKPRFTFQVFGTGTVIFTGIKDLADLEVPKELFKQLFTKYGASADLVFNLGKKFVFGPSKARNNKARLASRYPSAGTWDKLVSPVPRGYYIRPGTDGQPRLYPYEFYKNIGEGVIIPDGTVDLKPIAPKVLKAFKEVGKPIPESTRRIFREAGAPLEEPAENKVAYANTAGRRAPSWNATRNGYYVRPGPGQQPYWYKVPAGIAAGRKTVISSYTKAGRNIPAAVRAIFKIGNNVTINALPNHKVTMGLNGILRINGRQATRLTVAELVAIARNLNIPQVNAKMSPANIIGWIKSKTGAHGPNRTFNVQVGNVKYKLGLNYQVERTVGKTRTSRAWNTFPANERNALINAIVSANNREAFNALPYKTRYEALYGILSTRRENAKKAKEAAEARAAEARKKAAEREAQENKEANEFALELERAMVTQSYKNQLQNALKNYYKNGNEANLMKQINALPSGSRGKPLKANVNKAVKNYVKTTLARRRQELIRANFNSKLKMPNWLPNKLHTAYRKHVVNFASTPNQKGKYPTQKAIKNAAQAWVNTHARREMHARAAMNVENVVTGKITRIPAYIPPENPKVTSLPKRISPNKPAKKKRSSPKPPAQKYPVYEPPNFNSKLIQNLMRQHNMNYMRQKGWTQKEFVNAILKKNKNVNVEELQSLWNMQVVNRHRTGAAVGRIKR